MKTLITLKIARASNNLRELRFLVYSNSNVTGSKDNHVPNVIDHRSHMSLIQSYVYARSSRL